MVYLLVSAPQPQRLVLQTVPSMENDQWRDQQQQPRLRLLAASLPAPQDNTNDRPVLVDLGRAQDLTTRHRATSEPHTDTAPSPQAHTQNESEPVVKPTPDTHANAWARWHNSPYAQLADRDLAQAIERTAARLAELTETEALTRQQLADIHESVTAGHGPAVQALDAALADKRQIAELTAHAEHAKTQRINAQHTTETATRAAQDKHTQADKTSPLRRTTRHQLRHEATQLEHQALAALGDRWINPPSPKPPSNRPKRPTAATSPPPNTPTPSYSPNSNTPSQPPTTQPANTKHDSPPSPTSTTPAPTYPPHNATSNNTGASNTPNTNTTNKPQHNTTNTTTTQHHQHRDKTAEPTTQTVPSLDTGAEQ